MSLALCFVRGSAPYDRAIQLAEYGLRHHIDAPRPLCNHVRAERTYPNGMVRAIEAIASGVHAFDPGPDPGGQVLRRYPIDCTAEQETLIWGCGLRYVNRRTAYNWASPAQALLYTLTGRRADQVDDSTEGQVDCSQLATIMLRAGRIWVEMEEMPVSAHLAAGVPAGLITPARLEVWVTLHRLAASAAAFAAAPVEASGPLRPPPP